MSDQGRFILEGIPFSWFMDQKSALNVHILLYGDINIELEPAADAEHAAYHAAMQLLSEALFRRGAGRSGSKCDYSQAVNEGIKDTVPLFPTLGRVSKNLFEIG